MMKIRGRLKSIWPDRTQYKPYAYNLTFDDVFVELNVSEDTKIEDHTTLLDDGSIVKVVGAKILSLDGFTALLGDVADSIDVMNEADVKAKAAKRKAENSHRFDD